MAEEERIQRIVREIVSSEIGEPRQPNPATELPVNIQAFQNVDQELTSRFQMPRSFPANRDRERALTPLRAPDTGRQAQQHQIASSFNPRMNYGGIMNRRRQRRPLPYSRRTSTVTSTSTSSSSSSSSADYNKDVILLPSPTWVKVPRGSDKSQLQKLGCYVDAVRFSKAMSEDEVRNKIKEVFQQQLVDINGNPVR